MRKRNTKNEIRRVNLWCVEVAGTAKIRVGWNDTRYMDGRNNETVREVEEEFFRLQSGVRFPQEKR